MEENDRRVLRVTAYVGRKSDAVESCEIVARHRLNFQLSIRPSR